MTDHDTIAMQVTLLGTGTPTPDPQRQGPATLVRVGERPLLFDAGRGVVLQLLHAGVTLADVDTVFITHHHYDHIGELADLLITTWMERSRIPGAARPVRIVGPPGTRAIVEALFSQVYEKDLTFRTQGEPAMGNWFAPQVREVSGGDVWEEDGMRVTAQEVEHGHALDYGEAPGFLERWICLGYRVEAGGRVLGISGDCVPCEGLSRLAKGTHTLVQCCMLAEAELTSEHFQRLAAYTLTCSDRAGKFAHSAGVQQLVLTHIRRKSPQLLESMEADVRRDFGGNLHVGTDLLTVTV